MKKRKKEKNKAKKITIYKITGILLIISSLLLLGVILYINILPIKYLLIVIGILLVINIVCNFFLFRKKVKKKPKKVFAIISLIFSIIFLIGTFFIFKTFGVLDNMSQNTKEYTYHVMVLNDSNYEKIEDIENKTLEYYNDNSEAITKAISTLSNVVKTENTEVDNLEELAASLLTKQVEAILVEDSQKTILDAASGVETSNDLLGNFDSETKIIYTFKVTAKVETKEVNVTKDVFNIYISGMDEYGEVSEVSRSDVNIIMTINTKTKQILITNIPRDYYVQLSGTSGYKDKLTHAGIYGINTSIKTIEELLDIDINYYFKVNFSSLQNIVDALGGVEVYSEYTFQSYNGYNFTKGYNEVDGKAALAFVRERHSFLDGDNQRGKNQQAMIEAIFRKCTDPSIITKYNSLLNSLKDSIITNMPTKSITSLAKMQLKDNAKWTITSNSLQGTGSSEYTYTYPNQLLYVTVQNSDSVEEAKALINKVFNDETLEASYNDTSSNVHSVTKSSINKTTTTNNNTNTNTNTNTSNNNKPTTTTPSKEEPTTCDPGYIKDENGNCVVEEPSTPEPVVCDPGYHEENGECVPDQINKPEEGTTCEEGYIKDENGNCILNEEIKE